MPKTPEQLRAELAALEAKPGAPATAPTGVPRAPVPATERTAHKFSDAESAALEDMKALMKEMIEDDPKPYLDAHKRCAVCLRHQLKAATKCELCRTEGKWEEVSCHHPSWLPMGRKHSYNSTREHVSNLRASASIPFDVAHLRWILTWREGDGTKQVNAAKFDSTPYVLSYEQRCWCKQVLQWIEPKAIIQEPEPDAPEPEVKVEAITRVPAREIVPSELNKLFDYQTWKVERETTAQPSAFADWIASTESRES